MIPILSIIPNSHVDTITSGEANEKKPVPLNREKARVLAEEKAREQFPNVTIKQAVCNGFRQMTSCFEIPISIVTTGIGALLGTAGGAIYKCGAHALGKETKPIRHYSLKIASLGQKAGAVLGRIVGAPLAVAMMPLTAPQWYSVDRSDFSDYKRELVNHYTTKGEVLTYKYKTIKPCQTVAQILDETLYTPLFGFRRLLEERPAVATATPKPGDIELEKISATPCESTQPYVETTV